jgi:acyl-CoA dehydrogenase
VPAETPGIEIIRNVGHAGSLPGQGTHAYVRYDHVRVPAENLLGGEGQAFAIAQTRLGGGRIHHAMRTIGVCQKAFDLMCERALSRVTQGEVLAKKQMVQEKIADAYIALQAFRMLVLHAAWTIDQVGGHRARREIAVVKVLTPKTLLEVVYPALHLHGSLGTSDEMPLQGMWNMIPVMGIADGPTEVHKVTVARDVLKGYEAAPGLFPTTHLPPRREAARAQFAALLEHDVAQH